MKATNIRWDIDLENGKTYEKVLKADRISICFFYVPYLCCNKI